MTKIGIFRKFVLKSTYLQILTKMNIFFNFDQIRHFGKFKLKSIIFDNFYQNQVFFDNFDQISDFSTIFTKINISKPTFLDNFDKIEIFGKFEKDQS